MKQQFLRGATNNKAIAAPVLVNLSFQHTRQAPNERSWGTLNELILGGRVRVLVVS